MLKFYLLVIITVPSVCTSNSTTNSVKSLNFAHIDFAVNSKNSIKTQIGNNEKTTITYLSSEPEHDANEAPNISSGIRNKTDHTKVIIVFMASIILLILILGGTILCCRIKTGGRRHLYKSLRERNIPLVSYITSEVDPPCVNVV